MYRIPKITDDMREHMFNGWSEETLQSMAAFEEVSIPELKERLLEFAAAHNLDNLDGPGDKFNNMSQLDGAPVDGDTLNCPHTPTMASPLSQSSDDGESIFDAQASFFISPQTPFTPATVNVADSGSPVKRGNDKCKQLMWQIDGPDELSESHDPFQSPNNDGLATDADNKPMARMFDPQNSLKHRALDMDSLVAYNPDKQVVHLQGVDLSTGHLQADPTTLVISIESVVYETGQAGAAVFFHPLSPWNNVSWVDGTKKNAKLEALYIALNMISFTAVNDPNLKTVLVKSTSMDFCLANTALGHALGEDDTQAVTHWLKGASKTILSEINDLWTDLTHGANGHRAVDVRLWCVPEKDMQTVNDMALAYMYKQRGRDWYAENGKTRPEYKVPVQVPDSMNYLEQYPIVAPRQIVSQGPQAVSRWKAEAVARVRQCAMHKAMAADGCRELNEQLRDNDGALLSFEHFLEAYGLATHYMSADPQKYIDQFVWHQRAIRLHSQLQGRRTTNLGAGCGEGAEIGGDGWAESLVREVLEMDWEMDWE